MTVPEILSLKKSKASPVNRPSVPQSSAEQSSNCRTPLNKLGDKGTQVRLSQGDGEVLPEVDGANSGDEVDDLTMLVSVILEMVIVMVMVMLMVKLMVMLMVMIMVMVMVMLMVMVVIKGDGRAAAAVVANVPVRATAGGVQNRTIAAKRDNTTSWLKRNIYSEL